MLCEHTYAVFTHKHTILQGQFYDTFSFNVTAAYGQRQVNVTYESSDGCVVKDCDS